jgi:hypothetical protein
LPRKQSGISRLFSAVPVVLFDIVIIAFVPEENFREMDGVTGLLGGEARALCIGSDLPQFVELLKKEL